jgi:hypothetical protein
MDELDVIRTVGADEAAPDPGAESTARARLERAMRGDRSARSRSRRTRTVGVAVSGGVLAVAGLLAASFLTADKHRTAAAETTTYEAVSTVVERSAADGTWMCVGPHLSTAPPGCGTYRLANWDWSVAPGPVMRLRGARWVESVVLTGTVSGRTFTLTKPPRHPSAAEMRTLRDDGISDLGPNMCTRPYRVTGWTRRYVSGPTIERLRALPGVSGVWIGGTPKQSVVNVRFVADGPDNLATVRRVLPGAPVCLSFGGRPRSELVRALDELVAPSSPFMAPGPTFPESGSIMSGIDDVDQRVKIWVLRDDGTLQREVDERYGPNTVEIISALRPLR